MSTTVFKINTILTIFAVLCSYELFQIPAEPNAFDQRMHLEEDWLTTLRPDLGYNVQAQFSINRSESLSKVDAYIATQLPVARAGLLANIGPDGVKCCHGAKPGVVIASPSTVDPDYVYTWTRDSALVFKLIIDYVTSRYWQGLRGLVDDFISSQANLQTVSSFISTRQLSLIHGDDRRENIWPIVQIDLDYVARTWNQSTFDLWEEIESFSFFTTAVQHRALRQDRLLCYLQSYWNKDENYIIANTGEGRSGKDANTILASIHTFDPAAGCDSVTFQPCSDKALANLQVYVDSFRSVYMINNGIPSHEPVATGRYSEDVYMGGNPWYLTTFAVSEQLYNALIVWSTQEYMNITQISLSFFQQFIPDIIPGIYNSSSPIFNNLTTSIRNYADGFILENAKYTPEDGSLAEQYDRDTGLPRSALDLTWSYASALTTFGARSGYSSPGWGAADLKILSSCSSGPGAGVVSVVFNVEASTRYEENIFITGSVDALKNWTPDDNAVLLSAEGYPIWRVAVLLPPNTKIEYKYIRRYNKNKGQVVWESGPNREFNTLSLGNHILNDIWK
ncbi:glycosyl hydrolase 15 family protein [Abortiporus biennis]